MKCLAIFFLFITKWGVANPSKPSIGRISVTQSGLTSGCVFSKNGNKEHLLITDFGSAAFAVIGGDRVDLALASSDKKYAQKKGDSFTLKYVHWGIIFTYSGKLLSPVKGDRALTEVSKGKLEIRVGDFIESHSVVESCGNF